MRVIERTIEYTSRSDIITIIPLFDLHFGNAATDENLIRRTVKRIKDDPLCFWIGGGDYGDFINRSDRRYRETAVASWLHGVDGIAQMTRDRIRDVLKPVRDSCLGLLKGTHEIDILKKYEVDIYADLIGSIKPKHDVPIMLGIQGFIRLRLQRRSGKKATPSDSWTVIIYCHHGHGGGRLEGGHALALGRIFKNYKCDIALMGHRHVRQAITQVSVGPNAAGTRARDHYQIAAFCGSFLRSYSEDEVYSEEKGYAPLPVGPIEIMFKPNRNEMRVIL